MNAELATRIANAAGMVEKAIIKFHDHSRQGEVNREKPAARGNKSGAGLASFADSVGAASGFKDKLKTAAKGALSAAKGALANGLADAIGVNGQGAKHEPGEYEVKFNPSSIRVSARGGGVTAKHSRNIVAGEDENKDKKSSKSETSKSENVTFEFNVALIFDDVNNDDAFLEERLNPLSGGDLMKTGLKTASKIASMSSNESLAAFQQKDLYSVKDDVEAFIGAARIQGLNTCTFNWGKISFSGAINRLEVKYTMFNPAGEPIRAEVNMNMLLMDEKVEGADLGFWGDRYSEAFGQGTAPDGGGIMGGALNGSLLNLGH